MAQLYRPLYVMLLREVIVLVLLRLHHGRDTATNQCSFILLEPSVKQHGGLPEA